MATRLLITVEVACGILTLAISTLATWILAFRLSTTRPSRWLSVSESFPIALTSGFLVTLAAWYLARKIHRALGNSRQVAVAFLPPFVGILVLAAALLWPTGQTLLSAIGDNNVTKVRWTLRCGIDANTAGYGGWHHLKGSYAITYAARNGNVEIIRVLLDYGAEIDPQEASGPLLGAATNGHLEAVDLLLKAGADVNQLFGSGRAKRTAFSSAAVNGHFDVAEFLFASGANPELGDFTFAGSSPDLSRLKYLAGKDIDLKECLISAARAGHVHNAKFLLDIGYDANYRTHSGETALNVVESKLQKMETRLENAKNWTPEKGWAKPEIPMSQEWNKIIAPYVAVRDLLLQASQSSADKSL